MRSISPNIAGAEEFVIAEQQLEYMPVVACLVRYQDGVTARVIRYTLTPEERAKLAAGEDLYFGTYAGQQLQPTLALGRVPMICLFTAFGCDLPGLRAVIDHDTEIVAIHVRK